MNESHDITKVSRSACLKYCGVLAILMVGTQAHAQAAASRVLHTDGTKIVDADGDADGDELFLNGINLGTWLLWEGYLMMGDFEYRTHTQFLDSLSRVFDSVEKAAELERQWRLDYVDERAIADLKGLGFNAVRVPFHFNLFWSDDQLKDDGGEYLDRFIQWCRAEGLSVLLSMHAAPGYQNLGDHADNVNANAKQSRDSVKFWDGQNVQSAARVWRHIASHYQNEPVVCGYDLDQLRREGPANPSRLTSSEISSANAIDRLPWPSRGSLTNGLAMLQVRRAKKRIRRFLPEAEEAPPATKRSIFDLTSL